MSRQISLPDTDARSLDRADERSDDGQSDEGRSDGLELVGAGRGAPERRVSGRTDGLPRGRRAVDERRSSGRVRHDEKITVYVSADELFELEQARLVLRGEHGLAVDRGRIVREAVAMVLADLDARGESSVLVRRLRGD